VNTRIKPAAQQLDRSLGAKRSRARLAFLAAAFASLAWPATAVAMQRFQADEWVTECSGGGAGNCSIMVPFWQTAAAGKGAFALVVMLAAGNVGIVGDPAPVRAVLRVDKAPPATCRGARYCIFPGPQSLALVRQLANASLILIDVYTAKGQYSFSLSPKGYQAGIAQIRAWGYQLNPD
jgi:hypothetical protein